jgi:phosphonate transport system substrate-binding protein
MSDPTSVAKRSASLRFAVSRSNGGPALLDGARLFAAALAKQLGADVDVVVSYDYAALLKAVLGGGAELAWMPPLMHARAAAAGARLIALSQRGGTLGYHSAILVAGDRWRSVRELAGVRAAWVDRSSSSGYIFPRLHLLAAGLPPATLFASERFCGSATNACRLLAAGDADLAACFLSLAADRGAAQREVEHTFNTGDRVRVLDITAKIPPDGFVVAPPIDEARVHALRGALLSLHTSADGRAALETLLQAQCLARVQPTIVADLQRLVAYASS